MFSPFVVMRIICSERCHAAISLPAFSRTSIQIQIEQDIHISTIARKLYISNSLVLPLLHGKHFTRSVSCLLYLHNNFGLTLTRPAFRNVKNDDVARELRSGGLAMVGQALIRPTERLSGGALGGQRR
jgi:hypothetical protein